MLKRWPPRLPPTSSELIKMRIGKPGHFILHIKPKDGYEGADVDNELPSAEMPSNTPPDTEVSPHQQLPYEVTAATT